MVNVIAGILASLFSLKHIRPSVTVFQARIGLDGRLSNIRATDGPAELVPAALEAVKQWVYRPAKMNGLPIESEPRIAVPFSGR
jgi:hypothetical protein